MKNSTEEKLQDNSSNVGENQQSNQADVSPEMLQKHYNELEYAATLNPEIRKSEEFLKIEKGIKEMHSKATGNKNQAAKTQTATVENTEEEEAEEEEEEQEEKPKKDNPFGIGKKKEAKIPEKIEDIQEYMKKKYSVDEPTKFFTSVDKWRNDSQEKVKIEEELDGILSELEKAPDPLKAALLAHSNGQDWQEVLGSYSGRPDFNKPFDKNDTEHLVKYYFKDDYKSLQEQVTEGDLDDEQFEKQLKFLKSAVKPLFEKDRGVFENKRAAHMKEAETFEKNLRASVNSSVEALEKDFPDFKRSDLQKIKQVLVSGNVNSFFMEKNGTYQKDAAKRLAYVMYGDNLYSDAVEKAERKGTSKANEEIVSRGQKEISNSKSTQALQDKAAADAIAHLQYDKKKDYL